MTPNRAPSPRLIVCTLVVFALGLAACSGDEDTAAPSDVVQTTEAAPGDVTPAASDSSDLVVPLEYLQGEWCNTDGEAWVIEGDTARFGANHDELFGELPVSTAFTGGSGTFLVSQSDDEFVLDLQTREITFTRGRC